MQLELLQSDNTEQLFRRLYFQLYANSNASRSERILSDLSKMILLSVACKRDSVRDCVARFKSSAETANDVLIAPLAELFPRSVKSTDTFSLDDESLRHALTIIDELDLVNSPSHTLGDAFQALMGPRLRGDKGQFFTPRSVVRSIVDILAPADGMSVIDPACGTGGFLSAVLDRWRRTGDRGKVIGIDKDADLSLLASALATVHANDGQVDVYNTNSLDIENLHSFGLHLSDFDFVITNPPFGSKIGITDRRILKQYDLGHVWERESKHGQWLKTSFLRPVQDPQILFIELCIKLLRPNGRMAIVLPEGLFGNSGSGYIWDYLRSAGSIDGIIDCPRTTFQPGTDTKTNILLFKRGMKTPQETAAWIAVAYYCGHDKRGRSHKADGTPVPDDFAKIAEDWARPEKYRRVWNKASITDPYYLVPRYYDQRLSDEVANDASRLGSRVLTIGDLVSEGLISVTKGHEVGSEAYGTGDVPFIRTSDIHNFEISHDPTNCVSDQLFEEYKKVQNLKAGDIVMVVDGRYKIGRCAILHEFNRRCIVQSHLRIISVSSKAEFSPYSLLFGLSLPSVQREVRRLVFIQSTLGSLGSRIAEIRLPDPRSSERWGETVTRFAEAIKGRAAYAKFLQAFSNEAEL